MYDHRKNYIQDIIVIGNKGEYIEQKCMEIKLNDEDPIPRLIKQIEFIAELAKQIHLNAGRDKQINVITRIVSNEFSYYTKYKPLNTDQYNKLIEAVYHIAKKLPPNIHLVIATLPVLWTNEVLHNVGLYVQSPRKKDCKPHLHHFDKKRPHFKDPRYFKSQNETYPLYREAHGVEEDYYNTNFSPDLVLSNAFIATKDINQYYGAIRFKIAKKYAVATNEVCYEHLLAFGISDTKGLFQRLRDAGKVIPTSGIHTLASNTVTVHKNNMISDTFTHADPESTFSHVKEIKKITINNPAFGNTLTLSLREPQLLEPLKTENLDRPYKSREPMNLITLLSVFSFLKMNRTQFNKGNSSPTEENSLVLNSHTDSDTCSQVNSYGNSQAESDTDFDDQNIDFEMKSENDSHLSNPKRSLMN